MKKVGLITIHRAINYGASLQAFALKTVIEREGFDCEIIDLLRPVHKDFVDTRRFNPLYSNVSANEKVTIIYFKQLLKKVLFFFTKQKKLSELNKVRNRIFKTFDEQEMKFSKKIYHNGDELYKNPPKYDVYVTGSDQVWNPKMPFHPEPYFLTFTNPDSKRISYAPSFGISELPLDLVSKYNLWINSIDFLSVREEHGAKIIKQISSRDAHVVLDPTLLLTGDEWLSYLPDVKKKEPFILLYTIGYSKRTIDLAYYLQSITGYQIIKIGMTVEDLSLENVKVIWNLGPKEFVSIFSQAAIVATSSFHGVAFSINFQKPFFSILNTSIHQSNGSRIESLLSILGLENRIIDNDSPLPKLKDIELDYQNVNIKLEQERRKSFSFLKEALNE
ncbi:MULTISPECIES: polysaccharide pyruvyl transferase family protein [Dysgonomonas]|uniref:Polysaccharide pyruvyl transferase domain-containing protein n=1 Tax=Dysgonomonas gadei ATCC BAA-286 TaxID=742766 RepID=F5IUQ5_9BACT|nr:MULTISPECIES: polysaccharide pyruvyl transferase family protein [Dysgonomonas]EGK02955.1 hypothetical protein HMPREF9455_01205 [Dysgonomonas gadei ATCC BAA-286]MBF0648780.1 polysaccharide pyruvyl transferase family protein [Dysgonomonas sp. GY75]